MLFQKPIFTWEVQKCLGIRSPGLVSSADGLALLYRVPKSGDSHFDPKSLSGPPRDFQENTSILLQSAPKWSANGPMMPQKHSQTDFNFGFEKFPLATLQKFPPPENNMRNVCIAAKMQSQQQFPQIAYCSQVVEISEVLPMDISRIQS